MAYIAALSHLNTCWGSHGRKLSILHGHLLSHLGAVLVDEHGPLRFMGHGSLMQVLATLTSTRVSAVAHARTLPRLHLLHLRRVVAKPLDLTGRIRIVRLHVRVSQVLLLFALIEHSLYLRLRWNNAL